MATAETTRTLARERRLYAFNLGLIDQMLADVSEDEIAAQPVAKVNPPRWILGHLTVVMDRLLAVTGAEPVCPAGWAEAFGPGSTPNAAGAPTPSKAELVGMLREGQRRIEARLDELDPEFFNGPTQVPFEAIRQAMPSWGDFVGGLMSMHAAFHVGQLSTWRRMTGRPPLF